MHPRRTPIAAAIAIASVTAAHAGGSAHFMPMPSERASIAAPAAGTALNYYGGGVISNPRVVSVMWGSGVNTKIRSAIPRFSSALVNSTFVDQMAEYGTFLTAVDGRPGTQQTIGRGTYFGQVMISPQNTARKITDADVQAELQRQIAAGVLPKQDPDTLYMVYFPASVTINYPGVGRSCVSFGAYHGSVSAMPSADNILYSVEPDCRSGLSNITYAASHEFAEAVTDAIPTPGTHPAYPQAWNTSDGYEAADLCSTGGTLTAGSRSWSVTQIFRNSTGACSVGNYTSP